MKWLAIVYTVAAWLVFMGAIARIPSSVDWSDPRWIVFLLLSLMATVALGSIRIVQAIEKR